MKRAKNPISVIFFILFFSHFAYSQEIKNFEFTGTLLLSSQEMITYKLQYQISDKGELQGTSLTDIFGSDRTLCKIKGTADPDGKHISFEETGNVNTKSDADPNTFCFLSVKNASIKNIKGKSILQANFTGRLPNGEKCIGGSMYLVSNEFIEQLSKKHLNKDQIKNQDSLAKMQQMHADIQAKIENTYLHSNEVMRINWSSPEIVIEVSDSRKADGDEVAIYVNGKKMLDRFVISNEKKTIVVPFPESKANIRIEALNEGSLKMCTTNIVLRDNETNTNIVTIMNKGSNVVVWLNKTKTNADKSE